jgi:hypothetical protein
MLLLTNVLSDDTSVTLKEIPQEDFRYTLSINGHIECRYDTFEHAWADFGSCVVCTTFEEAKMVASL